MGNSPSTDSGSTIDISNFKLRQIIGKGGFGVVRIVEKRDTKQKYALKYINKKKCIKKQSVRNIFRERIILERCDHPFIINLQFAFQDDEHMFMVLDLAIGGDLRFHLVRNGILPEKTIRIYAMEIAAAISYLHSNDILHRDIKPENLLIDERGHIHLTDFNVAIMLKEKIPTSRSGTTAYMGKIG
jgi:serine/threonine protein kinase